MAVQARRQKDRQVVNRGTLGGPGAPRLGPKSKIKPTTVSVHGARKVHVPVWQKPAWALKGLLYPYFGAYVCTMEIFGPFGEPNTTHEAQIAPASHWFPELPQVLN